MGCVAVLNPHDLLKDRFDYNPMPLISPPPPSKDSFKPKDQPSNKPVSNSNRRKKSPQNKNNEKVLSPKNSNSGNKSSPKSGPNLVMGKVTILKRGEALEKELDNKENNHEEKAELSVKENTRSEKIVPEKKAVLSVKENTSEKIVRVLSDKEIKSQNFDGEHKKQKNVVLRKTEQKKVKKSSVFDNKKIDVLSENEDKKQVEDFESIQKVLMRYGPDPCMLPRFYAGSAFVDSPSPRALPLPRFLSAAQTNLDYASKSLCNLLKLGVGF